MRNAHGLNLLRAGDHGLHTVQFFSEQLLHLIPVGLHHVRAGPKTGFQRISAGIQDHFLSQFCQGYRQVQRRGALALSCRTAGDQDHPLVISAELEIGA